MKVPRPEPWAGRSRERAVSWGDASIPLADSPSLSRWLDEIRHACGAFELVTFAYLAWLGAILIRFHRNIPHAAALLAVHTSIAVGIAGLTWGAACWRNSIVRFARCWYPLPLYIFFFEELGGLVHAIFPGWFDRWLIAFDYNFAGVHPSIWLSRFASPALNDAMQFAYMTYFLYLVVLPAILYAQRDPLAFWTVMTSTAVAHYSVYVIAVLLPVESPYHSLAALQTKTLSGSYCTALIEFIERFGRVHGAAFPSAHVAGSMVAILASWRYRRWLFWVCLPFFAGMCVSTVYGRYHYIADVLGGIAVGAMGFSAGTWLMQRREALPGTEASSEE
jgi:membrane-associated phospholipid phosphatase